MRLRMLAFNVGLLALAGCASMYPDGYPNPSPRAVPCPTGTCPVTVTVRGCNNIDVVPNEISFQRGQKGDVEWTLDAPPGWDFAADPIQFKSSPGGNFGNPRKATRNFKLFNHHNAPGKHDYTVVVQDGSGQVCRKDPTILNY